EARRTGDLRRRARLRDDRSLDARVPQDQATQVAARPVNEEGRETGSQRTGSIGEGLEQGRKEMKTGMIAAVSTAAALSLGGLLGAASRPAAAPAKPLRVVADAAAKILEPSLTTAYITRNFGYMVYDMLFGLDEKGEPQPQMVEQYTRSDDGKAWRFTLREGLKFSDGKPVTAADAVASIERWSSRDNVGRAMNAAGAQWKVEDERSFSLALAQPFGMVLHGLAKPSGYPPVIMPERLAKAPTTAPLTEVVGSGPFLFKRDE